MPKITIPKMKRSISVNAGANLMQGLLEQGIPVASSCRGDAVCGKCWVRVIAGIEALNNPNSEELQLREKLQLKDNQRISCQVQVFGDIQIETPYW